MPRVHYLGNMGPAKGTIIDVKHVRAYVQGAALGKTMGPAKGPFRQMCAMSL